MDRKRAEKLEYDKIGEFEYHGAKYKRFEDGRITLVCGNPDEIDVLIPEGVTEIGYVAFKSFGIRSVVLPDSLQIINTYAFQSCNNLTSVEFGNGPLELKDCVFAYCKNLKEMDLKGVKRIGIQAFACCDKIHTVKLHEELESIEMDAFFDCPNLKEITLPPYILKLGYCSLDCVSVIHLDGKNLPKDIMYCATNKVNSFGLLIEMGGRKIILPKSIKYKKISHVEKLLNLFEIGKNNISSLYKFAVKKRNRQEVALEGYSLDPNPAAKDFLQRSFNVMANRRETEEDFLSLFLKFRDEQLLTKTICENALGIAQEKNWMQATAYVLEETKKYSKKDSKISLNAPVFNGSDFCL